MTPPTLTAFGKLLLFLERLDESKVWYKLDRVRDALMVTVTLPGERWEIEFFDDGVVEIERFVSTGTIEDEDILEQIFTKLTDN